MTVDATSQAESKPPAAPSDELHPSRRRLASGAGEPQDSAARTTLTGELRRPPHSALGTLLLGMTGLLVLGHVLAVLGRLTLGLRRPATLEVTSRGIRIEQRTMLLGRVLRARETLVPLDALLRVTREIKFARSGLYAGLTMLALGTYFGVGFLIDGIRAPGGSPSLLFMGLVVMMVGLVLDFGLSSVADGARGKCQVTVTPVRGRAMCVGAIEPERADATLRRVASQLGIEPEHPELNARRLLEEVKDQASQSFLARIFGGRKDGTKAARGAAARPPRRSSAKSKPAISAEGTDTANADDAGEGRRRSEPRRSRKEKEQRGDPAQPESSDEPAENAPDDDDERREELEQNADPAQPESSDEPAENAPDDKLETVGRDDAENASSPAARDGDSDAAGSSGRPGGEGRSNGSKTEGRDSEGKSHPDGANGEGGEAQPAETSLGGESTRRLGSGTTDDPARDEPTEDD